METEDPGACFELGKGWADGSSRVIRTAPAWSSAKLSVACSAASTVPVVLSEMSAASKKPTEAAPVVGRVIVDRPHIAALSRASSPAVATGIGDPIDSSETPSPLTRNSRGSE